MTRPSARHPLDLFGGKERDDGVPGAAKNTGDSAVLARAGQARRALRWQLSMQPELAVDRLQLGRLDQLSKRDLHRRQRAFQLFLPERQEALQLRKFREQVVSLPDIGLQQPTMIPASHEWEA